MPGKGRGSGTFGPFLGLATTRRPLLPDKPRPADSQGSGKKPGGAIRHHRHRRTLKSDARDNQMFKLAEPEGFEPSIRLWSV
jgi:hypothetical protein